MADFSEALASLCHSEFMAAKGNPERIANMIQRLMHSAGFTIAMGTDGESKEMSVLLIGAETLLNEAAADHGAMARLLKAVKG